MIPLLSIPIIAVHGQISEPAAETPLHHNAIALLTFVASGIFYSASGWIKQVRRHLAGEKVALDFRLMGKSVLIGLVLGIGAFVFSSYNGDTIAVSNIHEFVTQASINTTAILFIDKWLLGRSKPEKPFVGHDDDTDFELSPEEEVEKLPPGKDA